MIALLLALFTSHQALAFPAQFSVSPDNSQALLMEHVRSAQKSLVINIYMWTSFRLSNLVIEKIKEGVETQILVETQPFGGQIVSVQKKVLDELDAAIKASGNPKNKLFMMNDRNGSAKRRYTFDHAKYVVVDGAQSYVGSENFVNSGAMADPKRKGNRGWQVALSDRATAQKLLAFFKQDTAAGNADVSAYDPSFVSVKELPPLPAKEGAPQDNSRTLPVFAGGAGDVSAATFCASPKSRACIADFIRSARESLDIQHMSLPLLWPKADGSREMNPILVEAIAAAQRGVKVRILLNPNHKNEGGGEKPDARPNTPPPYDADATLAELRKLARAGKIPLEAAIMDNEALQLFTTHNKGMLADGRRAFVGSINGTWNAVENNREIAVALDSPAAAQYYGRVFNADWEKSSR